MGSISAECLLENNELDTKLDVLMPKKITVHNCDACVAQIQREKYSQKSCSFLHPISMSNKGSGMCDLEKPSILPLPPPQGCKHSLDLSGLHELLQLIMNQKTHSGASRMSLSGSGFHETINFDNPDNYFRLLTRDKDCANKGFSTSWKPKSPTEQCGNRNLTGCLMVGQMTAFFICFVFGMDGQIPDLPVSTFAQFVVALCFVYENCSLSCASPALNVKPKTLIILRAL